MLQFHLLSFEGPDPYSRAGGIASRTWGLAETLAQAGYACHIWFVGDPHLPGEEQRGNIYLHRFCQWLSAYHPLGVYDGEQTKADDYAKSLPPYLLKHGLAAHLQSGGQAVVIAEEWHTAHAVLHLDYLLRQLHRRQQVCLLWNANNTFGFEQIPWQQLNQAALLTTVSRYMRCMMQPYGVAPYVLPNGLTGDCFAPPDAAALHALQARYARRTLLAKIARFDPDKRWLLAIDTVAAMKHQGGRPLLLARGGKEAHGQAVLRYAQARGLQVAHRQAPLGVEGVLAALANTEALDMVVLESHLDSASRRVLLSGADAVLCNSSHEPFGLVGLETMAAGGLACTGCSGEDYAQPGNNALVLQSSDPNEFINLYTHLKKAPGHDLAMRRAGQLTAAQYAWSFVLEKNFWPLLGRDLNRATS